MYKKRKDVLETFFQLCHHLIFKPHKNRGTHTQVYWIQVLDSCDLNEHDKKEQR